MKFYYENFIIILYIDTHFLNLHFQDIITIPNLSVGLVQVTLDQYGCHDDTSMGVIQIGKCILMIGLNNLRALFEVIN